MMEVPLSWYCKNIKKIVEVSEEAISTNDGFICDCGKFVISSDKFHNVLEYGKRESVNDLKWLNLSKANIEKVLKHSSNFTRSYLSFKCCDCGKFFGSYDVNVCENGDIILLKKGSNSVVTVVGYEINGVSVCSECYSYDFYSFSCMNDDKYDANLKGKCLGYLTCDKCKCTYWDYESENGFCPFCGS